MLDHITCPFCKIMSSSYNDCKAVEEQIQCDGLRDGGHSMAENHHLVFMSWYAISNMFRDMLKKNGAIRDTIV